MHLIIKFLILIWICSSANADTITIFKEANTDVTKTEDKLRERRQLTYIPPNLPIYMDGPQQQNLPIIGTLLGGLPILGNNQNLLGGLTGLTSGLTGTLGNLGSLPGNLGGLTSGLTSQLGNLGGTLGNLNPLGVLGGLGGLGGLLGGNGGLLGGNGGLLGGNGGLLGGNGGLLGGNGGVLGGSGGLLSDNAGSVPRCPATQRHVCRCEPITIPPVTQRDQSDNAIEIEDQSVKRNADGSTEVIVRLSNGLTMFQKSNNGMVSKEMNGYFSLKISNERYLTVYYSINDMDYTVKAEVQADPPQTHI